MYIISTGCACSEDVSLVEFMYFVFECGLLDGAVLIFLFSLWLHISSADPDDGRVGGRCSPTSGCTVSSAKCSSTTSRCECEDGFVTDAVDFSCSKYD